MTFRVSISQGMESLTWWKWNPQRGWRVSARNSLWTPCWSPPRPSSFMPMTTTTTTNTTTAAICNSPRGGRAGEGVDNDDNDEHRDRDDSNGDDNHDWPTTCQSVSARARQAGRNYRPSSREFDCRQLRQGSPGDWSNTPIVRERGLTGNNWRVALPPLLPTPCESDAWRTCAADTCCAVMPTLRRRRLTARSVPEIERGRWRNANFRSQTGSLKRNEMRARPGHFLFSTRFNF